MCINKLCFSQILKSVYYKNIHFFYEKKYIIGEIQLKIHKSSTGSVDRTKRTVGYDK